MRCVDEKDHIFFLVIISIIVPILCTLLLFQYRMDTFDLQYYYTAFGNIVHGQVPYVDFWFDYPPLAFIPIGSAFWISSLLQNAGVFVISFQCLMILCNVITVLCIYRIGLKIYDENTAFLAGLLYATAFGALYFVMTKYDAFPTALMMIGIVCFIEGDKIGGYTAGFLGIFSKIYPGIILPFLWFHERETFKNIVKYCAPTIIVVATAVVVWPSKVISYVTGSILKIGMPYVNSPTYTLYVFFHDILGMNSISVDAISGFMYVIMVGILGALCFNSWMFRRDIRSLIETVLIAIFTIAFCVRYHSPQYILWYLPFVAILVADSVVGVICFYAVQVALLLEFPMLFNVLYTNISYLAPP
jgi:hypothetical protein